METKRRNKYNQLLLYISLGLAVIVVLGLSIQHIAAARTKPTSALPNYISSEIQSLEQELQGNLDEEARKNLEAKLELLYREATRQAVSVQNLTSTPARRSTFIPPTFTFNGQRETGIIENPSVPFSSMDFKITNAWQELVNGNYILIFAGSLAYDPDQGVLLLESELPGDSGEYLTPRKNGTIRIVKVKGLRLVLETLTNDIFYFDVPARRFVNSLDEIAATATPLPAISATPTPTLATPALPYP